jgi:hypothetical protein
VTPVTTAGGCRRTVPVGMPQTVPVKVPGNFPASAAGYPLPGGATAGATSHGKGNRAMRKPLRSAFIVSIATALSLAGTCAALASATSPGRPDFTVGADYTAVDHDGWYLTWNGVHKDALRTGVAGNVIEPIRSKRDNGVIWYQWEFVGTNECIEWDSTTDADIADTCTKSRASQWWNYAVLPGFPAGYGAFVNLYQDGSTVMYAEGNANNRQLHQTTNSSTPIGEVAWHFAT